jgi:hypothetical protein
MVYVVPRGRRRWEQGALQIRVKTLHQKDKFTSMIPGSNRIEDVVDMPLQFPLFSRHHNIKKGKVNSQKCSRRTPAMPPTFVSINHDIVKLSDLSYESYYRQGAQSELHTGHRRHASILSRLFMS